MTILGSPSEWIDLIDSLVPEILELVLKSWEDMPTLAANAREDPTSESLCRCLRKNRDQCNLPFRIHIQESEIDPAVGADQGRMDIVFIPPVPRETIYFCLECKRLNVVDGGKVRPYASEYVRHGMTRFISGQYAPEVRQGGMLAYVMDGEVGQAIKNVCKNIRSRHKELGMNSPGAMLPSSIWPGNPNSRETKQVRPHNNLGFLLHHLFVVPVRIS